MEALSQGYSESYALIIGIDDYELASNLDYAVSDAQAIKDLLVEKFLFKTDNVKLLINEEANRDAILRNFLSYVDTHVNDRVLFFFAGHGVTISGRNRDVGYLVPYDGNRGLLSSLIRWDELTRNADLIPAKHLLFIMDACYGGLALTRGYQAGSMRFLKDMTSRYSRQVITAGKANEVVADSGGPIPDHSVFTGHLIEGLNGKAADKDGNITANAVMAYVYENVSKDQHSNQTPHFGFLEGDGDFIFKSKILESIDSDAKISEDILVSVPLISLDQKGLDMSSDGIVRIKEYLSDEKYKIKLHEEVMLEVRKVISQLIDVSFKVPDNYNLEEFTKRLNRYEEIIAPLGKILSCIAFWGNDEQASVIKVAFRRLLDHLHGPRNGLVIYLALQWYPIIILAYMTGISAIANDKYKNLAEIFHTKINDPNRQQTKNIVLELGEAIVDLARTEAFKQLPEYAKHYTPMSDYLFKLLQPELDDLLFLGTDYEEFFDKFEILLALVHCDAKGDDNRVWGPIGRFGWKDRSRNNGPYEQIIAEAKEKPQSWLPVTNGVFSNYERFEKLHSLYKDSVLKNLHWY